MASIFTQLNLWETVRDRETRHAAVHGVTKSQTRLRNFTFTFHFHALEKEMATDQAHHWHGWASLVAQTVKNLPAMQETQVQSLGGKDPLEKGMATYSSILTWRIPRTVESGRLLSMGSQRIGHNWVTNTVRFIPPYTVCPKTRFILCICLISNTGKKKS